MQLGLMGLVGCGKRRQASGISIKAGPFAVTVPENWSKTIIVEKVPARPVYGPEEWDAFQKDAQRMMKPGYDCRPQHWAIRLPASLPDGVPFDRETAGDDPTAPQILIHKADEWGLVFTDGKHQDTKVADVLLSLRKNMDALIDGGNSIHMPAFVDASLNFVCLKQRVDFAGGHGIRMVAQWAIEPTLMQLGQLHYLFLGMSDDNSCQIIATFPINLPGLPGAEAADHLGYSTKDYDIFSQNFPNYREDAKKWLIHNQHEITPSLEALDGVMRSLMATGWKSS